MSVGRDQAPWLLLYQSIHLCHVPQDFHSECVHLLLKKFKFLSKKIHPVLEKIPNGLHGYYVKFKSSVPTLFCALSTDLPLLLQGLRGCLQLQTLHLHGNPVTQEFKFRAYVSKALHGLSELDGQPLTQRAKVG